MLNRSALYLPANRDSAIAKARTLPADCIILDLEDAVQPDAKDAARAAAVAAATAGGWGDRTLLLRVNALATPWSAADFAAVPGVTALLAGMADLAKDLRARPDAARTPLLYSLSAIVVAARASAKLAIDGVFTDITDPAGFVVEAEQGLMLGFDGKSLIHPSQVDPCNAVFSPTPAEIDTAQGLIAAYEAGLVAGKGVTTFNGKLVEVLHVETARRTLALADQVATR